MRTACSNKAACHPIDPYIVREVILISKLTVSQIKVQILQRLLHAPDFRLCQTVLVRCNIYNLPLVNRFMSI